MRLSGFLRQLPITLGLLTIVAAAVTFFVYRSLATELPPITAVEHVEWQIPLRIHAADGRLIAEFGEQRRSPVSLDEVPVQMLQAFVAAEDSRFYQHRGVDHLSLLRASLHLLRTREKGQGGSTITMQLARNLLLSPEKTYRRKLSEILLAKRIERALSKTDILERYLNTVFLGHRAYGVAAAAQVYYGLGLHQLDLAQTAMIAGLPQAPSLVNPITDPVRAVQRRNHVLQRMLEAGFIDPAEASAAKAAPITAQLHGIVPEVQGAEYFAEMVRLEMLARYGTDAYNQGFRVYTTLDADLQLHAVRALRAGLREHDRRHARPQDASHPLNRPSPAAEAALVTMDPQTGALRALVGGSDFTRSQFNRAAHARRQPGSAFKPLVYAVALEMGYSPATVLNDAPLLVPGARSSEGWQPRNFDRHLHGPNRLRDSLAHSRNLTAVRLLSAIGIENTATTLETWGLEPREVPPVLSLALGSNTLSPLALTRAYAVLANGGYRVHPWLIERVEDSHGNVAAKHKPPEAIRVLPEPVAFQMTDMLRDTIVYGTGRAALQLGRSDLAGKTGTSNGRRDAWFAGYGGNLLATIWVGFDDNRSLGAGETGASVALPIWIDFMDAALRDVAETKSTKPPGLTLIRIDADDGGRPHPRSRAVITEALTDRQLRQWETWHPQRPQPGPGQYGPAEIF